jgi:hypothetical protein
MLYSTDAKLRQWLGFLGLRTVSSWGCASPSRPQWMCVGTPTLHVLSDFRLRRLPAILSSSSLPAQSAIPSRAGLMGKQLCCRPGTAVKTALAGSKPGFGRGEIGDVALNRPIRTGTGRAPPVPQKSSQQPWRSPVG